jgi:hypothetical protein
MAAAQLVVNVRIAGRKVRNNEVSTIYEIDDLRGDPTRFGETVGADGVPVSELCCARGHDVLHEIVGVRPDIAPECPDRTDHKTDFRQRASSGGRF